MLKKVPHTYTIVFSIIIICAILTWIIPGGEYAREIVEVNGVERTVIVNDSFHEVAKSPQTWQVFSALFNGFEKQAGIIAFILIIGGAFWIMNNSKAIDVGIFSFLRSTQKLEHIGIIRKLGVNNIIITLVMLLFSSFGAIFGMSEETLAFVIIIVPLAISMGYDSLTGVCMVYVAAPCRVRRSYPKPFHYRHRTGIIRSSVVFRIRIPGFLLGNSQRDHDCMGITLCSKSKKESQSFSRV